MTAILETSGLSKSFGGIRAVDDVTLSVRRGAIHCLIGPNGAGKSTLFKLIIGTYAPTAGSLRFRGEDVTTLRIFERVRRGMSMKMQVPSVLKELPAWHNLAIALQDHVAHDRLEAETGRLLEFLGIAEQARTLAGALSHGQQQWLEIGMAIALRPELLLLDEPTAGMSPDETFRTGEMIRRLNGNGMTVLVVEHDMAFIRQIADRVSVLHFGAVLVEGTMAEVSADPRVAEVYLGKAHAA
jgi:branched-chain amino acid transport system ATP-binding protein